MNQKNARGNAALCLRLGSRGGVGGLSPTFPVELLRRVGSLISDPYAEPSYAEYDPAGTGYWSVDASIALRYFPYNRCDLAQCSACGRAYLRYTEAGGYYTENASVRCIRT